jgi:hypothetical protein
MRIKVALVCCLLFGLFCGFEIYYSTGIVGVTKKPNHVFATPGCFCHDQNTAVNVWISGPESLAAGREAQYRISVAKQSNIAAGFSVAAFLGKLGVLDSLTTQLMSANGDDTLEMTHTSPKLAHGRDTVSWSFWYRAPLTIGSIDTLYACGNSVDTSQDPSGDSWNFANNFLVRVLPPTSAREEPLAKGFRLLQNYPNPFNPSTTIAYHLAERSNVKLSIYDLSGKEVSTLVDKEQESGSYSVVFDGLSYRQLASGIYLYSLKANPSSRASAGTFSEVKRMLLIK